MKRRGSLLVVGLCALSATLSLTATDRAAAREEPAVRVSDRGLDLQEPTDMHLLYGRLQQAAARVCLAAPSHELVRFAADQRCMTAVLTEAVPSIEKHPSFAPQRTALKNVSDVGPVVTPCALPRPR